MKVLTKTQRLAEVLQTGERLTAKQITQRFGIQNPTATLSDLRLRHGYAVYTKHCHDTKGRRTSTKYVIGTPRRDVVAAGYRALAAGMI